MRVFGPVLIAALLAAGAAEAEENWPQFRGPRGDGVSLANDLPLVWNETNHVAWRVRVAGRGRSSPVIWGSRIWVTTAVEEGVRRTRIGPDDMQTAERVSLRAVCLDRADGRMLWEVTLFEVDKPDPVHWLNSWATPTPAVEPGRLYFSQEGKTTVIKAGQQFEKLAENLIEGLLVATPAVADRTLLIRTDGHLYRVSP